MRRMDVYHRDADRVVSQISRAYDKAQDDIQASIERIFGKFMRDGGMTPEKAQRLLNQKIPNPLLKLAKQIYPKLKNARVRRWLLNRMNAPAYRARITRLQTLQEHVYLQTKIIADVEIHLQNKFYMDEINKAYYQTMFDIQQGVGYGFAFASMPSKTVQEILLNTWSGELFSQRVWHNTDELAKQVTEIVTSGIKSGISTRKMTAELVERMNVGKHAANRLIRTETTYMANAAEMQAYKEAELDRYRFVATLDLRTSEVCRQHDNKVYLVEDATPGKNMPPMHPYCRSTTIAVIDVGEEYNMQRRARDPSTGKTMLVPANMSYQEWYEKHVKGA